jgi:hypothetical protein
MPKMNIYWGDLHDNVNQHANWHVSEEQCLKIARAHLDFYAPAYYTSQAKRIPVEAAGQSIGITLETWKTPEKIAEQWARIEELTGRYNEPGRFITFPAYEWQGDGLSGDHNVVFRTEGGAVHMVDTLTELYQKLRGQDAIAIPHHMGYRLGARGKDWHVQDDKISPFVEVFSAHGSSETDEESGGLRRNSKLGPCSGGQSYQDGLDMGYHIGATASPDGEGAYPGIYSWGLAAVLAPELTRDALWNAFLNRRVYGVTGDRIRLDFRINGALMGDCIAAKGARQIEVSVEGLDEIDRIELLRDGRVIHTQAHQGTWSVPSGRSRFKCRIEAGWGMFPQEAGPLPSRRWQGQLTLPSGAAFIDAQPCWLSGEQYAPVLSGTVATFTIDAPQANAATWPVLNKYNSHVFEFEANADDQLQIEMDGLKAVLPVAGLCSHSRVLADSETAVRRLKELYNIDPAANQRPAIAEMFAQRVKIHRAVPEAGYTCSFKMEDDTPLQGEHNYRIRVEQRNGQKAWSSPIWVRSNDR